MRAESFQLARVGHKICVLDQLALIRFEERVFGATFIHYSLYVNAMFNT